MAPAIGWPSPHNRFCKRQREAEDVAAPGEFPAHRLDEKAEARARPKTQQRDRASADDDHQRRPPGAKPRGRTKVAGRYSHLFPPGGLGARNRQAKRYAELMHMHENPKGRRRKIFRCRAALQNWRGQSMQFSSVEMRLATRRGARCEVGAVPPRCSLRRSGTTGVTIRYCRRPACPGVQYAAAIGSHCVSGILTHRRDLAAHCARGLPSCDSRPRKSEGAGKTGCALHPRSRVQLRTAKAHTSIQVQRKHSGLPCAVALRLTSCSPR